MDDLKNSIFYALSTYDTLIAYTQCKKGIKAKCKKRILL